MGRFNFNKINFNKLPINKDITEKIINFLLNALVIIFGIILLISLYTGVQVKILGNKYANFFGYSLFEVQTDSMYDVLNAGDWIVVKLTKKVKTNDIITYELKGEYITHRIIEAYNSTYITKGDANSGRDEPVDQSQVVGKLSKVLGNFGILRKTLFNPAVLIALIITLFFFNLALNENRNDDKILKKLLVFKDWLINLIKEKLKKRKPLVIENTPVITKVETAEIKTEDKTPYYEEYTENFVENELEKTSVFRVITIDDDDIEVNDKYKVEEKVEEEEIPVVEEKISEEELDKTSYFRVIPVDLSEIDNTFLEIAKNEIKRSKQEEKAEKKKKEVVNKEPLELTAEEEEGLTNINMDLLKGSKNKNIIEAMINIKREELNALITALDPDPKPQVNEPTIKNTFINSYIDAKYYNYYSGKDVENQRMNLMVKIEKLLKAVTYELKNSYKGSDNKYSDKVNIYATIFFLILKLEQAKESITEVKAKSKYYKEEIAKFYPEWTSNKIDEAVTEVLRIQKIYAGVIKYFQKKLETNTFFLNFNKVTATKNMYAVELQHNLSFNKIYSEYIIDKTYNEGIIAEDKLSVMFTLLLFQLMKDMTSSDFNKKYILHIADTLYTKEKKLWMLLKKIDDEYAKSHIIILISFDDIVENRSLIKNIRKSGYKFALVFDKEKKPEKKDRSNLYLADYIFIDNKAPNIDAIETYIPEDLIDNVIYDDIINKIGN